MSNKNENLIMLLDVSMDTSYSNRFNEYNSKKVCKHKVYTLF